MSAPVLRWLFIVQRMPKQFPALRTGRAKFRHPLRRAGGSPCSAGGSDQEPLRPTLRAIPFPKVTELFCRLPSATLFYRPEAANLGDLMRLWVRARERITRASDFQGQLEAHRIPHNARNFTTHCSLPPDKMIPGIMVVEKKR